jgi:ABC-type branched-subunit amino acid transport system ATPase component/ABC-type branched-subunit amino acid transport system permease subunit
LASSRVIALRALPWAIGAAVLAVAATLPSWLPPYLVQVAILSVIAAIFAVGLNLLMGYAGLESLGQAAFFGTGSYGVGLLTTRYHWGWSTAAPMALLITAVVAAMFGALAVRLKGLYFLLITLALSEVLWGADNQWGDITGGANGLGGIPLPWPALFNPKDFYYFCLAIGVAVFLVALLIIKSPFGLTLTGIRERELRSTTLGHRTYWQKYIVFIIAGVIAGVAGMLSAAWNGFTSTNDVSLTNSFQVMLMVIIGGTGTVAGPVVGAVVVTVLKYELSVYVVTYWLIIVGVIYIAATLWLRDGIVGSTITGVRWLAARARPSPARDAAPSAAPASNGDVLSELPDDVLDETPAIDLASRLEGLFDPAEAGAPGAGQTVLEAKGISKRFGDVQVLNDVDLRVARGERVGIIGLNGAGKTTLFQVLTGIEAPTDGSILMSGRNVTRLPPNRRNHLGLARTFQVTNLYPRLTSRENVLLALLGRRFSRYQYVLWFPLARFRALRQRADLLLDGVGLDPELGDIQVRHLSYGHQRQVEIALALASGPSLLLLDEPTAGLAQSETPLVLRLLEAMPSQLTLLIVEHNLELIFQAVDRIVVLHQGAIIKDGTTEEIRRDPEVKKLYFGSHVPDEKPAEDAARA